MPKLVATNKKAFFDYHLTDRFEAGIVLSGEEIKAIRARRVNITGSYVRPFQDKNGEVELYWLGSNFDIEQGDKTRTKKLLLHKKEIEKTANELNAKEVQIIPLELYLTRGLAKLKISLGTRKKKTDKRNLIKEREINRRLEKRLKN